MHEVEYGRLREKMKEYAPPHRMIFSGSEIMRYDLARLDSKSVLSQNIYIADAEGSAIAFVLPLSPFSPDASSQPLFLGTDSVSQSL